ncbi:hypothetical protein DPMN_022199 [Dreissena polymorpha]|uniref:Uncharacterized protein n=1 Tax=Dreissena polymorpha TaxID=45954 RepID=A0A9D4S8B5_DREPO|nr:hypothetical protein DPMN_002122 [Dreissena polymorpha]KAH3896369.1 hypothetical protein DPMN_020545 [Dreissena polymorpha]KAH3898003.1 hypothetical protein DPMN_022199 [Dreissena polymorpha]
MYWRQIGQPVKDVLWVLRINGILARHRTSTYLFPVHVEVSVVVIVSVEQQN